MTRTVAAALLLMLAAGAARADVVLSITLPDTYVARMVAALKAGSGVTPIAPVAAAKGGVLAVPLDDAQAQRMILDIGLLRARDETLRYEMKQAHIPVDAALPPLALPAQPK